jgi:hypothetical protein
MTGLRHGGRAREQRYDYLLHCRIDDHAGGKSGGGRVDEPREQGMGGALSLSSDPQLPRTLYPSPAPIRRWNSC